MKGKYWAIVLGTSLIASSSFADVTVMAPWAPDTGNSNEKNLYEILGYSNPGGNTALNAATTSQEVWNTGIGNQSTSLIVEYAANKNINTFGVYDVNIPANRLQIFDGAASAGATTSLIISATAIQVGASTLNLSSGNFGFYLGGANSTVFFSQPGQNNGSEDHLVTVNKDGGTYLAWEDLPFTHVTGYPWSDKDYNDMVLKISAVPEPSTMIAGALLLLPFGASAMRILRKKA